MRVQISSQHKHKRFRDIKNHQWITHKLHHNSKTSSLVILYNYLFVHDFVRLNYGFIHILTGYIVLGAHLLSPWCSNQCLHSWPREIVTQSSDSIAYCKSSNKSLLNSKSRKLAMVSHGIRPPGKWNESSMVYRGSLSFCDVRWNVAMACPYHCISIRNKCEIQIKFRC